VQINKKVLIIAATVALLVIVFTLFFFLKAAKTRTGIVPDAVVGAGRQETAGAKDASAMQSALRVIKERPDSPKAEAAYFDLAAGYENTRDLVKAREAYQKLVEKFPASRNVQKAQESIESINVKLLFLPTITPKSMLYEVRKGDTLTRISKKFNTTIDLIQKSNNLKGSAIKVGDKIKVPTMKFSILVDKSQNVLTLRADGEIFKTYRVSTGKETSVTPVGTFKIVNKIINPTWYPGGGKAVPAGDARNLLGTRWMGISKPSYGIHGTTDPGSIGKSVTEGCVRLKNSDVEELYSIVPEGTEVTIID